MQLGLLILFGVLAGIVLYQLYAVLGRRVGRQPEQATARPPAAGPRDPATAQESASAVSPYQSIPGASDLLAQDSQFDFDGFLSGAREAHRTIVSAFHSGDREALWPLLSKSVLESFESSMNDREASKIRETVSFLSPTRADLESVQLVAGRIQIATRFLAELELSSTEMADGPAASPIVRRTAEVWTFERPIKATDPNWKLIHVAAAEG